jgi:hypothetical protein
MISVTSNLRQECGNPGGGIGMSHRPGSTLHRAKNLWRIEQWTKFAYESSPIKFTIGDHDCGASGHECRGIGALVVARRSGQRNQQPGETDLSELSHRRAPGAPDEQVSCGKHKVHAVFVVDDPIEQTIGREIERRLTHRLPVASTNDVSDGQITSFSE